MVCKGMVRVGNAYESCQYYIFDLMLAGAIFKQVAKTLSPKLSPSDALPQCKVVIGIVLGFDT
jgi:methanogenic corrinoid protein MtbC1